MEYKPVNGPVYCRYAGTPPVINSNKAYEIGILAPVQEDLKAGSNVKLKEGSNVKLRIILDNRTIRMTCHGIIDWLTQDESTGKFTAGFGRLSLSEAEFKVLLKNVSDKSGDFVVFGERVRDQGIEASPVVLEDDLREIMRAKAVTMPVSLIEEIDKKRGGESFSEFVTASVKKYLKDLSIGDEKPTRPGTRAENRVH